MDSILTNVYLTFFATIITIFTFVLALSRTLRDKLSEFLKKRIAILIQRRYYADLDSDAYIQWRDTQLRKIYGEQYFTEVCGKTYPAFIIPFAKYYQYPEFKKENVYSKEDIDDTEEFEIRKGEVIFPSFLKTPIMTSGTPEEIKLKRKLYRKYHWIVRWSIRYPKLAGFSLDHYDMTKDGKITHLYPKLGTYEYNVYSSHILEFELFEAYKKLNGGNIDIPDLWKYLPFRHYIHFGVGNEEHVKDALFTGVGRYSLFSVQCIVVYKDQNHGDYRTLLMKRSTDPRKVAAKLGYYQFPPAGGFELYEHEQIHSLDMIKENYSLRKAIFREFLEEVLNQTKFQMVASKNNTEPTYDIIGHTDVKKIIKMIKGGTAMLNLIGVAVDLVTLRHEISFVLRIDDEEYEPSTKFQPNDEFDLENANKQVARQSLPKVEELLTGKGLYGETPKFNQASALLYKMFKDSPFSNI